MTSTPPAGHRRFREWVLASAPQVERSTSLESRRISRALTAIATAVPEIATVLDHDDVDWETRPMDACAVNVCASRGGPGGPAPCHQDAGCPGQTSCQTQACQGEACSGHSCGSLSCDGQVCASNQCTNNSCLENECRVLTNPVPNDPENPCDEDCRVMNCDGHDCNDHVCGTHNGEPGGDWTGVRSLAASAAWGRIVAAVADAGVDPLAAARELQVTLTRPPAGR
jgi:hypothetical protein